MQRLRAWLALSAALWLAAFVSPCHAQPFEPGVVMINATQAVFLKDSRKAWGKAVQGWVVGADCFYAQGLNCDDSGMITQISFTSFTGGLNGSIPHSISSLTALTYLAFLGTNLTGSIPNGLSKLHQLLTLDFSYNHLTGSIPSDIRFLPNLTQMDLSNNILTGSIPTNIFTNPQLSMLYGAPCLNPGLSTHNEW
ncbi:unnamed protein product [Closterium sp. Yama58-4]|nr:unnamed protein product [Closterium sp. Yama58-4]